MESRDAAQHRTRGVLGELVRRLVGALRRTPPPARRELPPAALVRWIEPAWTPEEIAAEALLRARPNASRPSPAAPAGSQGESFEEWLGRTARLIAAKDSARK